MLAKIDFLVELAQKLGLEADSSELQIIRKTVEEGKCYISFIGQYSAGKSCLINNLLHRDVLPKGIRETTPVLTAISFGEEEKAALVYNDGSTKEITIEELASVMQQNEEYNFEEIAQIEVYLNNALLQQGVVFLDTPGINTMIDRHEVLLVKSMALSSKVFYVSGNSPSEVDVDKLAMLQNCGLDIAFVRTHCDCINSFEESREDVIACDTKILAAKQIAAENCYFVSNEEESEWYTAINDIRVDIAGISAEAKKLLEEVAVKKLAVVQGKYIALYQAKKAELEKITAGDKEKLQHDIDQVESAIKQLEESLVSEQQSLSQKLQDGVEAVRKGAEATLNDEVKKAKAAIINALNVKNEQQMDAFCHKEAKKVLEKTYFSINTSLNPLLETINGKLNVDMENLPLKDLGVSENYTELVLEQNEELQNYRDALSALRDNYAEIEESLQGYSQEELERLNADIMAAKKELLAATSERNLPHEYKWDIIEPQGVQPSDIARKIGLMADMVTMFLPTPNKGGVVAKVGKTCGDVTKAVAGGSKVIANATKGMNKAMGVAKKLKDTIKKAGKITKKVQKVKEIAEKVDLDKFKQFKEFVGEKEPGLLDYMTIEYWSGAIASRWDEQPKKVLNQEYEAAYRAAVQEIEGKIRQEQENVYQKKCALDLFKDEKAKQEARARSIVVDQKQIAEKMQKCEKKLRQESEKQWRTKCAEDFASCMVDLFQGLLKDYLKYVPERLEGYQEKVFADKKELLEKRKDDLARLKNSSASEIELELQEVKDILGRLN